MINFDEFVREGIEKCPSFLQKLFKVNLSLGVRITSTYLYQFQNIVFQNFRNRFHSKFPLLTLFCKMEKQNDRSVSLDVHREKVLEEFANRSIFFLMLLRILILIIFNFRHLHQFLFRFLSCIETLEIKTNSRADGGS